MSQVVLIEYTNYRGERSHRRIQPLRLWFGVSHFHQGEQWFVEARDLDKEAVRSFACKDIHSWEASLL